MYLEQAKADKLTQQLSTSGGLQVPCQATQLLQKLDQVMPAFCLQMVTQPGTNAKEAWTISCMPKCLFVAPFAMYMS